MKHIIWSNEDLDYNDWKLDLEEQFPDSEGYSEDDRIQLMYELNDEYLEDEKSNLSKELYAPILVVGDIGCWDGRHAGMRFLTGTNLNNIFEETVGDYATWYVEKGEVKCKDTHHDGTNYYTYRVLRDISKHEFKEYASEHSFIEAIQKYTAPLGHYVSEYYGFKE